MCSLWKMTGSFWNSRVSKMTIFWCLSELECLVLKRWQVFDFYGHLILNFSVKESLKTCFKKAVLRHSMSHSVIFKSIPHNLALYQIPKCMNIKSKWKYIHILLLSQKIMPNIPGKRQCTYKKTRSWYIKCHAFAFQNEDIWSPFYSAMKSSLLYSDQAIRYTANIDIAPPQLPLPFGGW